MPCLQALLHVLQHCTQNSNSNITCIALNLCEAVSKVLRTIRIVQRNMSVNSRIMGNTGRLGLLRIAFFKRFALSLVNDRAERMSTGKSFQILAIGPWNLKLALKCLVDFWREGIY